MSRYVYLLNLMAYIVIGFLAVILLSCTNVEDKSSARKTLSFNEDWRFSLAGDSLAINPEFNDSGWRMLDLPHDWSIEGEFSEHAPAGVGGGALPGGTGWYRKTFTVDRDRKGKKVFIAFDGVYRNSDVWLNGRHLGNRPNGYISFMYDATPHLNKGGANVVVVRVDNSQQPNSRWYSGSGIYRNTWLIETSHVHVPFGGVYVTTPSVTVGNAIVEIETTLVNDLANDVPVELESIIYDSASRRVTSASNMIDVVSDSTAVVRQRVDISDPLLWSVSKPVLYKLVTIVKAGGIEFDRIETPFGIRTFEFDPHKGFSLNGVPMKINGVCNHHDLGSLGAAINMRALERQLSILKEMGVNAIRTSHNPPAPELLDLCDRMGFLVMDEMFDMWRMKKSEYDYAMYWDEWHARDLADFIKRDRNHPSVFLWSIGNEILEQWHPSGTTITTELASIVRSLDSTRPITSGNNNPDPSNSFVRSGALDLIGFNYAQDKYADFHKYYPGQKAIATETASALATRGHYDMPSDSIRRWPTRWDKPFPEGNPDNTVSAYDNVSAPWGATHEETLKIVKRLDHISGMFVWTGFDYLGEPTPYLWPSRSSYFGIVDLAGFPKDIYYMYQSEWTDKKVLHVFPHWNWEPGKVVDVWAFYNHADEAELFLNDVSMGVRKKGADDLHVMWRLKYEPGTIRVVTRKDGKEVLSKEIKTAGQPARLIVEADRNVIASDGKDLSFLTIRAEDDNGIPVPIANNLVRISITGDAALAAVDNGDQTSHASFRSHEVNLFNGLALAIVKGVKLNGNATITVESTGLQSASVSITLR